MTKILHLIRHELDPDGRGGHHRAYQIHTDLQTAFGEDAVHALSLFINEPEEKTLLNTYWKAIKQRIDFLGLTLRKGYHPQKVLMALMEQSKGRNDSFGKVPLQNYINHINTNGKPTVCLVDYPSFIPVIDFNRMHGIKTIYIPQNLESFDYSALHISHKSDQNYFALRWALELEALVKADQRLMISKLEKDIIQGLGLAAYHYPYLPVGEVRQNLLAIRSQRENGYIQRNLFLMFGSITHQTTYESFKWMLQHIKNHGLPDDIHLVVAGRGSEKLSESFSDIENAEFHGLLQQQDLEALLCRVNAVLVPQMYGFGAVTRIPEMACAGIPVIASQHTAAAMEIPPGVTIVKDGWSQWEKAMIEAKEKISNSEEEYEAWEGEQVHPLIEVVETYLR